MRYVVDLGQDTVVPGAYFDFSQSTDVPMIWDRLVIKELTLHLRLRAQQRASRALCRKTRDRKRSQQRQAMTQVTSITVGGIHLVTYALPLMLFTQAAFPLEFSDVLIRAHTHVIVRITNAGPYPRRFAVWIHCTAPY
jgi:hypothetical protein